MAVPASEYKMVDIRNDSLYNTKTLSAQIATLLDSVYRETQEDLYKVVVGAVEKPLIEFALAQTGGNQLKASRILGINRNTMRAKIKKLSIDAYRWKNS
jgi:DNA-binding protein Fis